jgi:hypothetical protein
VKSTKKVKEAYVFLGLTLAFSHCVFWGPLRDAFQRYRQEARQALGEAGYDAVYAEGRLLSLDKAMADGLRKAEAALQP